MLVPLTIVTEVQTPYTVHVCSCMQNSLSIYVQYNYTVFCMESCITCLTGYEFISHQQL